MPEKGQRRKVNKGYRESISPSIYECCNKAAACVGVHKREKRPLTLEAENRRVSGEGLIAGMQGWSLCREEERRLL